MKAWLRWLPGYRAYHRREADRKQIVVLRADRDKWRERAAAAEHQVKEWRVKLESMRAWMTLELGKKGTGE